MGPLADVRGLALNDTLEMTMWIGDGKEPTFSVTYKRKKK